MKVKIIDLLNRKAEGKSIPVKIKRDDEVFIYDKERNDYKAKHGWYYFFEDILVFSSLNEEVEVLDNKTIDEIYIDEDNYIHTDLGSFKGRKMDVAFVNKLNELTKLVNNLNNTDTSKETNCMSD